MIMNMPGKAWHSQMIWYTVKKWKESIIQNGAAGSIDAHAHKASILWYGGIFYHFYTAVTEAGETSVTNIDIEFRCITVAASVPWSNWATTVGWKYKIFIYSYKISI